MAALRHDFQRAVQVFQAFRCAAPAAVHQLRSNVLVGGTEIENTFALLGNGQPGRGNITPAGLNVIEDVRQRVGSFQPQLDAKELRETFRQVIFQPGRAERPLVIGRRTVAGKHHQLVIVQHTVKMRFMEIAGRQQKEWKQQDKAHGRGTGNGYVITGGYPG